MKPGRLLFAVWLLWSSLSVFAQLPAAASSATILQMYREELKPGKEAQYFKIETEAAARCRETPCPQPYLTVSSFTGPGQVWYLNSYDSFAAMEKIAQAYAANSALAAYLDRVRQSKEGMVTQQDNVLAQYRPDLSQGEGLGIAGARYFLIEVVQVRPGHGEEYEVGQKILTSNRGREGMPRSRAVYQVISGLPDGTYVIFTALHGLRDAGAALDDGSRAGGSASGAILNSGTNLFAVSPQLGYGAKEWIAADPEFWGQPAAGKSVPRKKPAANSPP